MNLRRVKTDEKFAVQTLKISPKESRLQKNGHTNSELRLSNVPA
jgi:hypothetical protein